MPYKFLIAGPGWELDQIIAGDDDQTLRGTASLMLARHLKLSGRPSVVIAERVGSGGTLKVKDTAYCFALHYVPGGTQ